MYGCFCNFYTSSTLCKNKTFICLLASNCIQGSSSVKGGSTSVQLNKCVLLREIAWTPSLCLHQAWSLPDRMANIEAHAQNRILKLKKERKKRKRMYNSSGSLQKPFYSLLKIWGFFPPLAYLYSLVVSGWMVHFVAGQVPLARCLVLSELGSGTCILIYFFLQIFN